MNKQDKLKELIIEQLKKIPINQIACEKTGLPRSTFYKWKIKDKKFSDDVDKAIYEGKYLINDLAESQLLNAIKDRNMTAILFWLKSHHKDYGTKVEITGKLKTENESLTPEQEELLKKALELASFNKKSYDKSRDNNQGTD
jgi:ACT domain-containing protein